MSEIGPAYQIVQSLELPHQSAWGDLLRDPRAPESVVIPLRDRSLAALVLAPGGTWTRISLPSTLTQPRLRGIGHDGAWYVTSPNDPRTIWIIDPQSRDELGRMTFYGRFDPDTRLALRVMSNGDAVIAGCGVPGLQRLARDGSVVLDYYALREEHRADFAWRGVVALAVDESTGVAYLVNRNFQPAVLVIDPQQGCVAKMKVDGDPGWAELVHGQLLVLEMDGPSLSRWDRAGGMLKRRSLPTAPWHHLHAEQFLLTDEGQVHLLARQNKRVVLQTVA